MKTFLLALLLCLAQLVNAANWYVLPTSAGNNGGTAWTNAFAVTNITWASVSAGDTIWLAGGTYTSTNGKVLDVQKGGTSGAWLNILRATANDTACTSAAGWLAGYGTNAWFYETGFVNVTNYNTVSFGVVLAGSTSFVNVDGRTANGISIVCNSNMNIQAICVGVNGSSKSNITFANLEMVGPCPAYFVTNTALWNADTIWSTGASFSPNQGYFNAFITLTNCSIHGFYQAVYIGGANDPTRVSFATIIDHCQLYNIGGDVSKHSDLVYSGTQGPLVFRYNDVWNWSYAVIYLFPANNAGQTNQYPIYIYGNVFHEPSTGTGINPIILGDSGFFTVTNSVGPIFFYNNTIYSVAGNSINMNDSRIAINSQYFNNLFIKNQGQLTSSDSFGNWNYNYSDTNNFAVVEPNYIYNTGINPLVSPGIGGNFNIVSNISSIYPRNKGTIVTNIVDSVMGTLRFNLDPAGNTRGADGAWDIGAYEYVTSGGGGGTNVSATATMTGTFNGRISW